MAAILSDFPLKLPIQLLISQCWQIVTIITFYNPIHPFKMEDKCNAFVEIGH